MKTLFSLIAVSAAVLGSAQNISTYKFVRFPEKFSDFNNNQYALRDILKSGLERKNFSLVETGAAPVDECSILTADIKNSSSMFRNRLDVILKDCKNQPVATYRGMSLEKDFEVGYREAMTQALKQLPVSSSTAIAPVQTQTITEPVKAEPAARRDAVAKTSKRSGSGVAEVFSDGQMKLNKIVLSSSQFILANPDNSAPYGVFSLSGKPEVYHVKLQGGWALGYRQGDDFVLEVPKADGTVERRLLRKQ